MNWVNGGSAGGTETHHTEIIRVIGTGYENVGFLITNGHFTYCEQNLDHVFLFHNVFEHCKFTYSGSPFFAFDKSNQVEDSTLEIPKNIGPDSPNVKPIKDAFPQLKIVVRDN
jgi:hypothetical protein